MITGRTANRPGSSAARRLGGLEAGVFLYYIAFFVYALGVLALTTNASRSGYEFVGRVAVYAKLAAFLLLACKMALFQRQPLAQWAAIAALGLLGLASYAVTGEPTMLALILFAAAAKGVDWRVLAGLALVVNLLVLGVAVAGCCSGLLDDFVMNRDGVVGVRRSMGFSHPNSFGLCLASACAALFALRGGRIGLPEALVGAACCWIIVEVSDSRTAALGVALAYALFFAAAHVRARGPQRALCLALTALVAAVVAASLYLMVSYDSSVAWQAELNRLVSGRLYYAHYYFTNYPPGLLGQDTGLLPTLYMNGGQTTSTFVVDNAYARLYLRYGPVFLFLVLAALAAFFWRANRAGAYGIVLVGIAFAAVYGFGEHMFIRPEFNYFMVIGFSWLLYGFPEGEGF